MDQKQMCGNCDQSEAVFTCNECVWVNQCGACKWELHQGGKKIDHKPSLYGSKEKILHSGFLQRDINGKWIVKYFELYSTAFLYCEKDGSNIKKIPLSVISKVVNSNKNKIEILIRVNSQHVQKLILKADNTEDCTRWIKAFGMLIKPTKNKSRKEKVSKDDKYSSHKKRRIPAHGIPGSFRGILKKKGEINPKWKKRYFVISDQKLMYFGDQNSYTMKGIIPLPFAIVREGQSKKETDFQLLQTITSPVSGMGGGPRTFYLRAKTIKEKDEWVKHLRHAAHPESTNKQELSKSEESTETNEQGISAPKGFLYDLSKDKKLEEVSSTVQASESNWRDSGEDCPSSESSVGSRGSTNWSVSRSNFAEHNMCKNCNGTGVNCSECCSSSINIALHESEVLQKKIGTTFTTTTTSASSQIITNIRSHDSSSTNHTNPVTYPSVTVTTTITTTNLKQLSLHGSSSVKINVTPASIPALIQPLRNSRSNSNPESTRRQLKSTARSEMRRSLSLGNSGTETEKLKDIQFSGYLKKRGQGNKAWKQRYFVIRQGFLMYFDNQESVKTKGQILLCKSQINQDGEVATFQVTYQSRTYYLQAADTVEKKVWVDELRKGALINPSTPNRSILLNCEGVLTRMRKAMDSEAKQIDGCVILRGEASRNPNPVTQSGAAEIVIEAMQRYPSSYVLQENGCAVLANMAWSGNSSWVASAVSAVLIAMEIHDKKEDVQEEGCRALGNMAFMNSQDVLNNPRSVVQIINSMSTHIKSSHVQCTGCGALLNLDEEAIVQAGAIPVIIQAMREYASNEKLQHEALSVLFNLTFDQKHKSLIINAKSDELIIAAIKNYPNNSSMMKVANGTLKNINARK